MPEQDRSESTEGLLSSITRWDSDDYDVELPEKPDGIYVLFSDLPALIARVREDERGKIPDNGAYTTGRLLGYVQGQRDEREAANLRWQAAMDEYGENCAEIEREACIEAVEAHIRADLTEQEMFCGRKSDLIAAIHARGEKP